MAIDYKLELRDKDKKLIKIIEINNAKELPQKDNIMIVDDEHFEVTNTLHRVNPSETGIDDVIVIAKECITKPF